MLLSLKDEDLNIFDKNFSYSSEKIKLKEKYTLFHFDEKWIFSEYISKYKKIEPSFDQLKDFINLLIKKTSNNLVISTGNKSNVLIQSLVNEYEEINKNFYFKNFFDKKVYVTKDLNFFELKKLIHNCNLIITCHGASTHLASGFDKKIIDIFDESQRIFYNKWNSHIRNYTYLYRAEFKILSEQILSKI